MKKEISNKKSDAIKVLDKGKNFDGPIILISLCCGGMIIPFRS